MDFPFNVSNVRIINAFRHPYLVERAAWHDRPIVRRRNILEQLARRRPRPLVVERRTARSTVQPPSATQGTLNGRSDLQRCSRGAGGTLISAGLLDGAEQTRSLLGCRW